MATGIIKTKSAISGTANSSQNINGDIHSSSVPAKEIFSNTTEYWNSQKNLIGKKDCLYVYTDYAQEDNKNIPAFKVGDGNAYLIDTPFTYMGNVTPEQIDFWNNKVTAYEAGENLILTKERLGV